MPEDRAESYCPPGMVWGDEASGGAMAASVGHAPMTGTWLDWLTNWGAYMPRTHCLTTAEGGVDWPWVIALFALTVSVVVGYLRIFWFWRKCYLEEEERDRNRKMMHLAYIFLWCAVCGYGLALVMYGWPVYRLLAICLLVLNVVTWKFAWNLTEFRVSLSAKRLARELEETLRDRNEQLERQVAARTAELQQKHEALTESEGRFNRMVANVPGMVYQYTEHSDGTIGMPYVSGYVQTLYGITPEQAMREPRCLFDAVHPEDLPGMEASIAESRRELSPWLCEYRVRRPDGEVRWLRGQSRPERKQDGTVCWDGILVDVTAQRRIADDLADARDAAESANRAKSEFLANISHEIRTPLGAVIGFSELLLEDFRKEASGELTADQQLRERTQWAETVRGSGKHLLSLISDVLDLSKIEAGKMEFETIACSPHRVLGEVISVMRVPAVEKGLDLSLRYLTPIPETIETDPTRLRQVIFNLVHNAVKFTEVGHIRVLVSFEAGDGKGEGNSDGGDEAGGRLLVQVADTGIGMDQQAASRLFQPFSQADTSVTRRFGGTGLGLCISQYIIENLGGAVRMTSEPNVGTTFTVSVATGDTSDSELVPVDSAEAAHGQGFGAPSADAATAPASGLPPHGVQLEGRRVLLVDDGVTNRQLIGLLLRRAGVEVTEASDGKEAVDRVEEGAEFDVILMDMQMPVLDGYSAARRLRERGCETPIVALTAHAMSGDRERCLAAGCSGYLTKPVNRDELLAVVAGAGLEGPEPAGGADTAEGLVGGVEAVEAESQAEFEAESEVVRPLRSTLPMDDPEFAQIAVDFVETAERRFEEFRDAVEAEDLGSLRGLAHWLRGVSGSAGYAEIQRWAETVERATSEIAGADASDTVERVRGKLDDILSLLASARAGLPDAIDTNPDTDHDPEADVETQSGPDSEAGALTAPRPSDDS